MTLVLYTHNLALDEMSSLMENPTRLQVHDHLAGQLAHQYRGGLFPTLRYTYLCTVEVSEEEALCCPNLLPATKF